MIINKNNGEIILGEILLNPKITFSKFKKTGFYNLSKPFISNPPWKSYWIKDIKVKLNHDKYIGAMIIFFNVEDIAKVDFGLLRDSKDFSKWDQKLEEQRKIHYDNLLEKILGIPPYIYSWGKVESYYDPKGCTSGILVTYKN